MEIREFLSCDLDRDATVLCAEGALNLVQRGLQDWGWTWDAKGFVAMRDGQPIGVMCYEHKVDRAYIEVGMTYVRDDARVFAALLLRLRAKARELGVTRIGWGCHAGNEQMQKASRALGGKPGTTSWTLELKEKN